MPFYISVGEPFDIRVDVESDGSFRLHIDGVERGHFMNGEIAVSHVGMTMVQRDRLEATIADRAMLAARLARNAKDSGLKERALDFLKRNDLLGTPLKTGKEPPCSKPSEPS